MLRSIGLKNKENSTGEKKSSVKSYFVKWKLFNEETFSSAKKENKPVLLFIHHSACYWSSLMMKDCFHDPSIIQILNDSFICIQIEKDEYPDIDFIGLTSCQIGSGSSGWPVTIFLTPDKNPFFSGTYFSKGDRGNIPGFFRLLKNILGMWTSEQTIVRENGLKFVEEIKKQNNIIQENNSNTQILNEDEFVQNLLEHIDLDQGGYQGNVKFPPIQRLKFLLSALERKKCSIDILIKIEDFVKKTLIKMSLGGLHDIVGGGYHRYSTDSCWMRPRFEKMLLDNAAFLELLSKALRVIEWNKKEHWLLERSKSGIVNWFNHYMLTEDNLLGASSISETDGMEGLYYLWSKQELEEALGIDSFKINELAGITDKGNFIDESTGERIGLNILSFNHLPDDFLGLNRILNGLNVARSFRISPARDDRCFISANSLSAIGLLSIGDISLAKWLIDHICKAWDKNGYIPHYIFRGNVQGSAYADGLAYFAKALFLLGDRLEHSDYLDRAQLVVYSLKKEFYSIEKGYVSLSPLKKEPFITPAIPFYDQHLSSVNSVVMEVFLLNNDREEVEKAFKKHKNKIIKHPHALSSLMNLAMEYDLC